MMEGSSLRMTVGMYSAFGTLEEMSWGDSSCSMSQAHTRVEGQLEPL
jgi:hypothetical protein